MPSDELFLSRPYQRQIDIVRATHKQNRSENLGAAFAPVGRLVAIKIRQPQPCNDANEPIGDNGGQRSGADGQREHWGLQFNFAAVTAIPQDRCNDNCSRGRQRTLW